MISEIVKDVIIAMLGLTAVSFLLIIVAAFLSIVIYIAKDTFKNNSRITRQALLSDISTTEEDDDIDLEIGEHLKEIEDKVNKWGDSND